MRQCAAEGAKIGHRLREWGSDAGGMWREKMWGKSPKEGECHVVAGSLKIHWRLVTVTTDESICGARPP